MAIFLIPMALSVVGAGAFCFLTDLDWKLKSLAAGLVLLSIGFQFVPAVQTHFIIPLLIQVGVGLWVVLYLKVD